MRASLTIKKLYDFRPSVFLNNFPLLINQNRLDSDINAMDLRTK